MEKNKPLELALQNLIATHVVENTEYRFAHPDLGFVNSFASMKCPLFKINQPYRIKEGRIIRRLSGRGKVMVNLIEHTLEENTVLIIPQDSILQLSEISSDYDFQMIAFSLHFLSTMPKEDLINVYQKQCIVMRLSDTDWKISGHYFSLLWEILQSPTFQRETVQHMLSSLLYYLQNTMTGKHLTEKTPLNRQEEIFHRFIALVNEHSKQQRTVNFYADKLCLTPRYLGSVIRKMSQQTVMDWINHAVTLEAQVLLKYSNLMIYQIADELNFPNPSFFSKFFKKMTGMTPVEYQKK